MRITGVEPARLLTLEPKSSASANSAISANICYITIFLRGRQPRIYPLCGLFNELFSIFHDKILH